MLDKIKKLFIVEDNDPLKRAIEEKSAQENKQTAPTPDMVPSRPQGPPPTAMTTGGKVTDKFMNILLGAMDKNNLDGFDYLEYKQSLQSLKAMNMDEATRYQSAFAMAKTMGATPQNLLDSAGHYLSVLQKEEAKFQQALTNQKSKQIGEREQRAQQLAQTIAQKEKQIEQLTKEIQLHREESDKIAQQISNSTVKVENTKNNFVVTYKMLATQIQEDVNKIKQYLK